ncbi:MAG TPA: PAS domain-containing protein [Sphingomicrobium sp.]|nr:PAS domain-containing protein [Sphingomicrobium sp.]
MINSTMPAGCWDLDLSTGVLALCRLSRTMFGLGPDCSGRLTQSEWQGRLHPDDVVAVHHALTASLANRSPYAERFRTIHADGCIQLVLGIGRPVECDGRPARFVGWNFDVEATGEMAAEWIVAHPESLDSENSLSVAPPWLRPQEDFSTNQPSEELLERARSMLRVRNSRERLFGRSMVGEPAFDLLLSLYVRSGQKETSLSKLASAAGIPHSSAIRWIRYLCDKGLLEIGESISDRRAICAQLTPAGRATMEEFLMLE